MVESTKVETFKSLGPATKDESTVGNAVKLDELLPAPLDAAPELFTPEDPPEDELEVDEFPAKGAVVLLEHEANANAIAARTRRFFIATPTRITLVKDTLYFL